MEKKKLTEARQMIQRKEYAKASALLETMLDNDTAMKWYLQIEQIVESKKTNENTLNSKRDSEKARKRIVFYIFVIVVFVIAILILREQAAQSECEARIMLGGSC